LPLDILEKRLWMVWLQAVSVVICVSALGLFLVGKFENIIPEEFRIRSEYILTIFGFFTAFTLTRIAEKWRSPIYPVSTGIAYLLMLETLLFATFRTNFLLFFIFCLLCSNSINEILKFATKNFNLKYERIGRIFLLWVAIFLIGLSIVNKLIK